jgi:hypothetical protein
VLADFGLAFHEVDARLFGGAPALSAGEPEQEEQAQDAAAADAAVATALVDEQDARVDAPQQTRRRRDAVWRAIQSTPNFWETLQPMEEGAVARIHELMMRHRWEVFFITQRPGTEGDTVQRQTQRWLVRQGFDLPSVLVLGGSRGAAAGAMRLDYHIDDSPQNCLDVLADSKARTILVVPDSDQKTIASARMLGIGTARGISECLDILEQISTGRSQPGLLARLATLVGWR